LYNSVNNENFDIGQRAAAANQYYKTIFNQGQQPSANGSSNSDQAFQQRQNGLIALGPQGQERADFEQQRHMSGVPEVAGQLANRPVPEETRGQVQAMQVLGDKGRDLLAFAQAHKGTIDPKNLQVGAQKAEEMMNYYNNSIKGGVLTQGRLAWLDKQISKNPTSIFQDVLGNNAKLQEIVNSNDNRKNLLLKSVGFNPKPASQSQPQYKTVNGVKYIRGPNGEAIKVK
jgi:hypothetical protein